MPILFIGTGLIFILAGLKGNAGQLYNLLAQDFTGKNNYIYWMVSILVLGSLGYVPSLQKLSRLFLILVLLVLLLDNKGFFAQLQNFINSRSSAVAGSQK